MLAAWLSEQFKMSLTLGSFLAGILLAETEFRHKIVTEIRPFQDILMGMFFIVVGMQSELADNVSFDSFYLPSIAYMPTCYCILSVLKVGVLNELIF